MRRLLWLPLLLAFAIPLRADTVTITFNDFSGQQITDQYAADGVLFGETLNVGGIIVANDPANPQNGRAQILFTAPVTDVIITWRAGDGTFFNACANTNACISAQWCDSQLNPVGCSGTSMLAGSLTEIDWWENYGDDPGFGAISSLTFTTPFATPEPATALLLSAGLAGFVYLRRRGATSAVGI